VQIDPAVDRSGWDVSTVESSLSLLHSPLFSVRQVVPENVADEVSEEAESPLVRQYELNGVILLPGNKSIAIIRRIRDRENQMYRRGDRIDSYEVVKIERHRVLLSDGFRTSPLPMYHKHMVRTSSAPTRIPAQPAESPSDFSGANQFKKVLSRSDVENRVFSKVNQILTQIAISPHMVNGQMEGLRLIRVPSESIVYELGGRSGDIIKRVNGHELDQVDQMYKLWENVKDDSLITVDLERKNQLYSYSFDIRE
jgi:type II secretion system protein C